MLVNGVWYDNELGNIKAWAKMGFNHTFGILPNSTGINIVKCTKCNWSRMWISVFEIKRCAK
jgi:hypothetical protein